MLVVCRAGANDSDVLMITFRSWRRIGSQNSHRSTVPAGSSTDVGRLQPAGIDKVMRPLSHVDGSARSKVLNHQQSVVAAGIVGHGSSGAGGAGGS